MDPNACLQKIDDFLREGKTGENVDDWCDDLRCWIRHGGFEPVWAEHPLATSYYHCRASAVQRARDNRPEKWSGAWGTLKADAKIIVKADSKEHWTAFPEDDPERSFGGRSHQEALGELAYWTGLLADRVSYQPLKKST